MIEKYMIKQLLTVLVMSALLAAGGSNYNVKGDFSLPKEWTVFALPFGSNGFVPSSGQLESIPKSIVVNGQEIKPAKVVSNEATLHLEACFGGVKKGNCALLYMNIDSPDEQIATLGFGADWWFDAWLNGRKIVGTGIEGNKEWPPSITNYPVDAVLSKGGNLLVVKFVSGSGTSLLTVGGPSDLLKIPKAKWATLDKPTKLRRHYGGVGLDSDTGGMSLKDAAIVIPKNASLQERKAAEELSNYLGRIINRTFSVSVEGEIMSSHIHIIYIGATEFAARQGVGTDAMNEEQWLIRTIGGNLVLAGGGMRGTLFAAWHFLEDICGVRWWTPYEESVPSAPELAIESLDMQGKPAFKLRLFSTHGRMITSEGRESLWAPRNRVNSELHWTIPVEFGGSVDYGTPGFVHTEAAYLGEMKKRGILKPEWCALKDGRRGGANNYLNQLCLSNMEMRKAFLEILKDNIANDRKRLKVPPTIYNISLNDTSTKCECPECAEKVRKYGYDTGLLLEFVNQMADGIAETFPDVKISTLAYMNTEPVPFGIYPARNVIITLCDTQSNYIKPIPEDDRFGKLLANWRFCANDIFVWDYHCNFADRCIPMPFESTVQTDWQLFHKNSVKGIFTEYYPFLEDLWYLRIFLMAKLGENPFANQQKIISDFTEGYYGKAGRHVREYIRIVNEAAKADDVSRVSTQSPMETCKFITPELAVNMQKIYDCAEEAVKDDDIIVRRLRLARLAADKTAFILYDRIPQGTLSIPRQKLAERIRGTVNAQFALVLDGVLPYWKARAEHARDRFLKFLDTEFLWDDCDNIDRLTWGQKAWRPKPYASLEVGRLSFSQDDKFSGKGSIRFEVAYDDVIKKRQENPKTDRIGINYLHGSDFSRYTSYQFQLKCESDHHPEIYVSIGGTKWTKILERDEKTNGWKCFRIPSAGLFKAPCTHTYLRLFSLPDAFKPEDSINLLIDEMKLFTEN